MTEQLCALCGAPTKLACSRCMQVFYCGPEHQQLHWDSGHAESCGQPAQQPAKPLAASKGSHGGAPLFLLSRRDAFRADGIAALARGDWSAATTACTHAYRLAHTFYGESHPDMLVECTLLACAHTQTDHYQHSRKMAGEYLDEAAGLCALSPFEEGGLNAVAYSVLGEIAAMQQKPELAVQLFELYISMLSSHFGPRHLTLSDGLLNLSRLHCGLGQLAPALEAAQRSHQIRLAELGQDHPAVADSRYNIGVVQLLLGSPHDAQREFVGALDAHVSPNTTQAANLRFGLGMAEHQIGSYAAAHSNYLAARRIREQMLGKDHPAVAELDACLNALNEDSGRRIVALNQLPNAM